MKSLRRVVVLALAGALMWLPPASSVHAQGEETPSAPGNPHLLNLNAEAGHQQVTLTWDAAPDDEKARITGYEVQQGTTFDAMLGAAWTAIANSDSGTTSHTVTGLTNGTAYYFSVRATGPGGAGLASPHVSATPMPRVTNMAVTSSPKKGDTYGAGEKIEVTVTFSEAMTVVGTPFLRLTIGSSTQQADYASGSGTTGLVFAHTVEDGDNDTDGISIPVNHYLIRADRDTGTEATIRNASGVDAVANPSGLSDQSGHKVSGSLDTASPTVTGLGLFSIGPYTHSVDSEGNVTADEILVRVFFSEEIVVTGTPTLGVKIGSNTRTFNYDPAKYIPGSAIFKYTVQASTSDMDTDGISVAANSLTVPSGASIKDKAGNVAVITHSALPAQADHPVNAADITAPTVLGVGMWGSEEGPYGAGDVISVEVYFTEEIVVVGTPTLAVTIGANTRTFSYVTKPLRLAGPDTAVFEYTVVSGDSDSDGISVAAGSVTLPSGVTIKDTAGNNAVVTHSGMSDQADHKVSTTVGGL